MSVDQPDDDEYVTSDPERPETTPQVRLKSEQAGPRYWQVLTGNERVAVVRWLQRGDAVRLLRALALNPTSPVLRGFAVEALTGGASTGWRMRLAAQGATGGAPKKADRGALAALRDTLASGGDVSMLAARLSGRMTGSRARRGPVSDPMQAAMIGLAYYAARGGMDAEKARANVHRLYGRSLGDKNIQRLISAFNRAGKP